MIDSLTDTALTKGRERSAPAPGMAHADTHTPLHGPTGGVPSDKALSDTQTHSNRFGETSNRFEQVSTFALSGSIRLGLEATCSQP
eukprot:scaffold9776_cov126-Isochrysis_galbana.AAC.19